MNRVDKKESFTYDNSIRKRQRTERVAVIETEREKPSPAESGFQGRGCEVHPGVDPAKGETVAGYGLHTLRVQSER